MEHVVEATKKFALTTGFSLASLGISLLDNINAVARCVGAVAGAIGAVLYAYSLWKQVRRTHRHSEKEKRR